MIRKFFQRPAVLALCLLSLLPLSSCLDRYDEGMRAGLAQARSESQAAYSQGRSEGYDAGYADGQADAAADAGRYAQGLAEGYAKGYDDGLAARPAVSADPLPPELDATGFVELAEAVPDVIIELRYYATYNFVGQRLDGYAEPVALLTREAAGALREVSDELVSLGYRLKIYDAYRPQSAVDMFVQWSARDDESMKEYFYPEVDKADVFSLGYVAQYSGHSRGSTVDLTLFDMAAGRDADMGGVFDYFGERSHRDYTAGLTQTQLDNRRLLRQVMEAHGFKSLSTEWWHFTLIDEPYPDTYFNFPVTSLSTETTSGN